MAKLGINSRHTFNDTRNRLKMAGLIDYKTYNGKAFSSYTVLATCKKNAQVAAQVTAQVAAHLNKTETKTKNKEKIKRKETVPTDLGLKFEVEKKKKEEAPSPTLEQVVAICLKKGMSREEAEQFFYYYDAQGWVTSSGQKIKRVDSMVNRWLTNNKTKTTNDGRFNDTATQKQKRNEEIARDILSRYM